MTKAQSADTVPTDTKPEPAIDCQRCARLVAFRKTNTDAHPDWFNGAVQSFGNAKDTRLLIVGLAPGMQGANKTGRPFTGDYAGDLLYATLIKYGFASGTYAAHPDDGLVLKHTMVTNAVRCVPPANKPTAAEINTCRIFLTNRINSIPNLRAILALGRIAHDSVLTCFSKRKVDHKFAHGACHEISDRLVLFDSYHCSRYNTNTGRLTPEMFENVFKALQDKVN